MSALVFPAVVNFLLMAKIVVFFNRVPEYLVKSITWQTLQAVNFCHKHNVSPLASTNDSGAQPWSRGGFCWHFPDSRVFMGWSQGDFPVFNRKHI